MINKYITYCKRRKINKHIEYPMHNKFQNVEAHILCFEFCFLFSNCDSQTLNAQGTDAACKLTQIIAFCQQSTRLSSIKYEIFS